MDMVTLLNSHPGSLQAGERKVHLVPIDRCVCVGKPSAKMPWDLKTDCVGKALNLHTSHFIPISY